MEWPNQRIISLIDLYRENPCLWNPDDQNFKNNDYKNECWKEISEKLNCNVLDVKKKMDSLCASFRRERQKLKSISSTDKDYQPKWFAYKHLTFLMCKSVRRMNSKSVISTPIATITAPKAEFQCLEDFPEASIIFEEYSSNNDDQEQEIQEETIVEDNSTKNYMPRIKVRRKDSRTLNEPYLYKKPSLDKKRDGSDIFGEHVALKHRSYSDRTRCIVEHLISNILFKADMGQYDNASTIEYAEDVNL